MSKLEMSHCLRWFIFPVMYWYAVFYDWNEGISLHPLDQFRILRDEKGDLQSKCVSSPCRCWLVSYFLETQCLDSSVCGWSVQGRKSVPSTSKEVYGGRLLKFGASDVTRGNARRILDDKYMIHLQVCSSCLYRKPDHKQNWHTWRS